MFKKSSIRECAGMVGTKRDAGGFAIKGKAIDQ